MKKLTKAVKAVILNENGEILLLQRNLKKSGKDNWDFPGGLIEEGEDEKDALAREVKEELDVEIEIVSKGGKWKFFRPLDGEWVAVQNYNSRIISGEIALSDEHIDFEWVDKKDLRKYPVKDESFYEAIGIWKS